MCLALFIMNPFYPYFIKKKYLPAYGATISIVFYILIFMNYYKTVMIGV